MYAWRSYFQQLLCKDWELTWQTNAELFMDVLLGNMYTLSDSELCNIAIVSLRDLIISII